MSKIKKVLKKVAPIAAPILGGIIGGPAGIALGAAGGAIGGGGLKGALLGGLGAGATNFLGGSGFLGSAAGTPLDKVSGIAGLQGPTQGSGILGSVTRGASGLSSALKGGLSGTGSGGLSLSNAGNIISGLNAYDTQDDLEKQLLAAQGKAQAALDPFFQSGLGANQQLSDRLKAGFSPDDLENDPGYQFRLAEGNKALDRQFSASGMSQSGAALKAAQQWGQGLAQTAFDDDFQRWLRENAQLAGQAGQGFQAAGDMGGIFGNIGDIGANADVARNNILTGTLSSVLRGSGTTQIIGYDEYGRPIYAQ